jgi:hypothetical protein
MKEREYGGRDDVEAILWSDCPEEIYLERMLRDQQMDRVLDGKSLNDSLAGDSTIRALLDKNNHTDQASPVDWAPIAGSVATPGAGEAASAGSVVRQEDAAGKESSTAFLMQHEKQQRRIILPEAFATSIPEHVPGIVLLPHDTDLEGGSADENGRDGTLGMSTISGDSPFVQQWEEQNHEPIPRWWVPSEIEETGQPTPTVGEPAPEDYGNYYDQTRTEGLSTLSSEDYGTHGKLFTRQSEDGQPTPRWWVPSDFEEMDHPKDAPRTPERGRRKAKTPGTPQTEVSCPHQLLHPEEDEAENHCCAILTNGVFENKVARRVLIAAIVLVLAFLGLAMYAYFKSRNDVIEPVPPSESNVGQFPPRSPDETPESIQGPILFTTAPVEMMVPSPSPAMQQTVVTESSFQPTQATAEQETGDPVTMKPSHSPVADAAPTNGPTSMPTTVPTRSPSSRPTVFPTAGTPAPIQTSPPSKAPTESAAINELKALLLETSPDSFISLQDVSSPQYQALDWLLEDPFYSTYSGPRVVQRWAMAAFFFSTNGINWDQSDNWLGDMNECSWFSKRQDGVCDGDGNVRSIDLSSNNLAGILPAELSLFSNSLGTSSRSEHRSRRLVFSHLSSHLSPDRLFLNSNKITGTLPPKFGRLTNLVRLQVTNNDMIGPIPTEIGLMSSLGT